MRKWWLVFVAILLLLVPLMGRAQGEVSLSTLEIKLWPEYDTPDMLVWYTFDLPASTPLPIDVSFRIPAAAGQAYGYGYYPEGGGVPIQENYQQRADGGWLVVSFRMRSLSGTLEYYDPALIKSGKARHFEYFWPGDYAVETFTILAQQPIDAQAVILSPAASTTMTGQNELLTHAIEMGRQPAGATFTVSMDYQKATTRLSVADMSVQPTSPLPEDTAFPWPWVGGILVILGVGVIVGAVLWYRFAKPRAKPTTPRHRKRSGASTVAQETQPAARAGDGDGVYCHQCGRRATVGDRFCRSCGTALRVD